MCYNEFSAENEESNAGLFGCSHTFCKFCDASLQMRKSTCPLCRGARKKFVKRESKHCPVSHDETMSWLVDLFDSPECTYYLVESWIAENNPTAFDEVDGISLDRLSRRCISQTRRIIKRNRRSHKKRKTCCCSACCSMQLDPTAPVCTPHE